MVNHRFATPEESPGLLFWQVSTLWKRAINSALAPFGITHTQFVILSVVQYLAANSKRITQTEISNLTMIDVMTISKTVRLLEKNGLIQRYEDESDSRAKKLQLTQSGERVLEKATVEVEKIDEDFFFTLDETYAVFLKIIKRLKDEHI